MSFRDGSESRRGKGAESEKGGDSSVFRLVSMWLGIWVLAGSCLLGNEGEGASPEKIDYLKQIKPILTRKCQSCHGSLAQKGSLRVDAIQFLREGGDMGPAVVAGKVDESLILDALTGENGASRMPQEGEALPTHEIELIRKWIEQGAPGPQEESVPSDPRNHWSYQQPVKVELPSGVPMEWGRNPVDALLAKEHQKRGLQPIETIDRRGLLRRVYLDLIGLPPTPEEMQAFLADESPQAYERVVDQLLSSPHYGERWGRHWMDVWRYSDWDGYGEEVRESHPHIWRWRDWIVDSLNEDKSYAQMVREMLAGDELAPNDPETLRATGYLVRNWYRYSRDRWLDTTVEHTGKAFLASTINCARCHDHMYDPIVQQEYYHFRAFFESHDIRIDTVPTEGDTKRDGLVRVFDAKLDAATFLYRRGDEKQPDKEHPITDATVPTVFKLPVAEPKKVELKADTYYPDLVPYRRDQNLERLRSELQKARGTEEAKLKTLEQITRQDPPAQEGNIASAKRDWELAHQQTAVAEAKLLSWQARWLAESVKLEHPERQAEQAGLMSEAIEAERRENVANAQLKLLQARHAVELLGVPDQEEGKKKLAEAQGKLSEAEKELAAAEQAVGGPGGTYSPVGTVHPAESTGKRTALANWITDKQNPRTARVAINHIWLRHFGKPLVPTVFDFGVNGKGATHPELLDWLAVELMEQDWKMKPIHRLLVTSRAYQLASTAAEDHPNRKIDPENQYLWRMNSRRLEAEIVRDMTLAVSGSLDPKLHGADIPQDQGLQVPRRSIYFRSAKEKRMEFLALFDSANVLECYRRDESIVPQQALAMANSQLTSQQARLLARKLIEQTGGVETPESVDKFIELAFERILNRPATDEELKECRGFLEEQATLLKDPSKLSAYPASDKTTVKPSGDPAWRAREDLVLVLMNHNDFVTAR